MRASLLPTSRRYFPIIGLCKPSRLLRPVHSSATSTTNARQWSTPLAKDLANAITTTGPVSIANYMRQCLTSPDSGYYTTRAEAGTDPFGKKGDFVTSPEISQVFGELVGIWIVAEWIAQGKPQNGVQLIELGPGRGTLMSDVLRTVRNFKPLASALDTIYLIEASPSLREAQKELLCGQVDLQEHAAGYQSKSAQLPKVSVVWAEDFAFLPKDQSKTSFMVAHEFFDALPIHTFQAVPKSLATSSITTSVGPMHSKPTQKGENEWRELVVSVTPPPSVINPPKEPSFDFQMTLSPTRTHHSNILPNLSPRYKALLGRAGSTIEICPNAQATATQMAQMIGKDDPKTGSGSSSSNKSAGAALIIDYGPSETIPVNSLRGIRSHKRVSPLDMPGRTDISADVDFGALAEAALAASEDVDVHGPIEQAHWLKLMGGEQRVEMLLKHAAKIDAAEGEELSKRILTGWRRLIDLGVNGMGKLYKVMAILPRRPGQEGRRPVGFGGDV